MAQINVNFRMDEEVKKRMEQACKEMGLSMTTAFTMFATKVGNEKRIPFEITANPSMAHSRETTAAVSVAAGSAARDEMRERLEDAFTRMRRVFTNINTAIPSAAFGMTVERLRLLCADELKDKITASLAQLRATLSDRTGSAARDERILEQYRRDLAGALADAQALEVRAVSVLRAWNGEDNGELDPFVESLADLSRQLDELQAALRRYAASTAQKAGDADSVRGRICRCAEGVSDPDVIAELRILEALVRRRYEMLDEGTRNRLEGFYLPSVEHVAEELGRAERCGEDTCTKVQLCLRAIQVVSQTITTASQSQREMQDCDLEAEVTALERLAAMRGDVSGDSLL